MTLKRFLEAYVGDLDVALGYRTPRVVLIRDWRLGGAQLLLQAVIGLYVVVYQVILCQQYMTPSDLVGSVRLQMLQASSAYRWPNGTAPYCAGVRKPLGPRAADFTVRADGTYAFTPGGDATGATFFPQRACEWLDETGAIPLAETDRVFLSSEERVTLQTAGADVETCVSLGAPACSAFTPPYNKSDPSTRREFVADVEYFTLLVDHNVKAPLAGLARTVKQMSGRMLGPGNVPIDPCDAYASWPGGCPPFIAVGVTGLPDIISIRTLLAAAGVPSLDTLAGTDDGPVQTTSRREAGLVLVLDISYGNYLLGGVGGTSAELGSGSMSSTNVDYTYKVSTVPNTEYKFTTAASPFYNETYRELYTRHGIRILVTTSGRIGYFNFQNALINLSVSLSLLAVATLVVDFLMNNCCPLRNLYKQYKERQTVDMSDIRRATLANPAAIASFKRQLETDPFAIEPQPEALTRLLRPSAAAIQRDRDSADDGDLSVPLIASLG